MTSKTRNFVIGAVVVLGCGLAVGLVAYLRQGPGAGLPAGVAEEIRYVPANAEMVAFVDVREFMDSELHKQLASMEPGRHKGRDMMHDFAGVDLERQVNRLLVFAERVPSRGEAGAPNQVPRVMGIVRGTFDQQKVQQFIRDRQGVISTYKGREISSHPSHELTIGFLDSGLIALGHSDLVRAAIDRADAPGRAANLSSNEDMMKVIRGAQGSAAWAVGRFDAVQRGLPLPEGIAVNVPPLKMVSARADIDGGIRAAITAETGDEAAANQLRDLVRGFLAMARLHGGANADVERTLKTLELSGTGTTVQLSLSLSAETLRAIAPKHRGLPPEGVPGPADPGTPSR